jgi:hypothetical protein
LDNAALRAMVEALGGDVEAGPRAGGTVQWRMRLPVAPRAEAR